MRTTLALLASAVAVAVGQTITAASTMTATAAPNFTPDASAVNAAAPIVTAILASVFGGIGIMACVGYGLYQYELAQREVKVIAYTAIEPVA
jgi:hypothetical protein